MRNARLCVHGPLFLIQLSQRFVLYMDRESDVISLLFPQCCEGDCGGCAARGRRALRS